MTNSRERVSGQNTMHMPIQSPHAPNLLHETTSIHGQQGPVPRAPLQTRTCAGDCMANIDNVEVTLLHCQQVSMDVFPDEVELHPHFQWSGCL